MSLMIIQPLSARVSFSPLGETGEGFCNCHAAHLVIEVDGGIHEKQKQNDGEREKVLKEMGLRMVRFPNEEVIQGLPKILGKIRESL